MSTGPEELENIFLCVREELQEVVFAVFLLFRTVFGQFVGRMLEENFLNIPLRAFKTAK